ncbi:unnamed protein product, partial [Scytosiphon promiscuus]
RFEIVAPTRFGLVCFRLVATDSANEELSACRVVFSSGFACSSWSRVDSSVKSRIVASGLAFFSSTKLGGRTCLRVSVGGPATERRHVQELWDALTTTADDIVAGQGS